MPGLMADINRRWSGVSAYSPTRRLVRPTGRTANAGTAQRIIGGGVVANRAPSAVPSFGAPGWQPRQGPMFTPPPPQPEGQGGWRGVLGDVVGSPIGRAAMAGLNVLGIPQRAVASTINEVADAFNGGDSSFGDWWDQTFDPTFGMRDVIGDPTGIGWLDSTIAFGLDVATDPLTYAMGSGIFNGISRRGRAELAARIGVEMGEEGAALAAKVGKFGPSALSDTERTAINRAMERTALSRGEAAPRELLPSGYRYKIPFVGPREGVRIPGTGAIDRAIGGAGGRIRAGLTTKVPEAARIWRPEGLENAIYTLVTGDTSRMSTITASALIEAKSAGDLAAGKFAPLAQQYARLEAEHGRDGMNAMRIATENGEATPLADLYNRIGKLYQDHGGYLEMRQGYQPRVLTPEGRAFLDSEAGRELKSTLYRKDFDLDQSSAHMMTRKLLPRDEPYLIGGREFYVHGNGTIDDLNTEFRRVFPEIGADLYHSDARDIFTGYMDQLLPGVHTLGRTNRLATAGSRLVRRYSHVAGESEHPGLLLDMVNKLRGSDVAHPEHLAALEAELKAASTTRREALSVGQGQVANVQGSFGVEAQDLFETVTSLSQADKNRLRVLLAQETRQAGQLGVPTTRRVGPQIGTIEVEFSRARDALDAHFVQLQHDLAAIDARAAAEKVRFDELEAAGRMPSVIDFPALSEQRRLRAEAASVSADSKSLEVIRQRAAEQRSLRESPALNPDDDSFFGQVTGTRSGAVGGQPSTAPPPPPMPVHPSQSPQAIRTTTSTQRRELVTGVHPQLARDEDRIESFSVQVAASEARLKDVASAHHPNIAGAQHHLEDVRRSEADYLARIDELSGVPSQAAERQQLQRDLAELRSDNGALGTATRRYDEARAPVTQAKRKLIEDRDQLNALKRRQEVAAAELPGRLDDVFDHEALAAAERRRNNHIRSAAGRNERRLAGYLDQSTRDLAVLDRNTARVAGGRFEVDAAGNVHPRFDEGGVARLVEDRDNLVNYDLADARSEAEHAAARHNDLGTAETRAAYDAAHGRVVAVTERVDELNRRIAGPNRRLVRHLERRQRLIRDAADSQHALVASGDTLRKLDDDVAALRALRDASVPVEGEPLGNQLARINEAERRAVHRADTAPNAYRTDWDDVPAVPSTSAGVYTPTERGLLADAYSTRRALRGVPDARLSAEQRVALREANQTIKDITTMPRPGARLRPRPPRDSAAVLDNAALGQISGDLDAATAAHLPTYDRLVTGRPAANTVARAKVARRVVADNIAQAGQMVEAGIVDSIHVGVLQGQVEAFDRAVAAYGANPSPFLRDQVEQLGGDMARWAAVLSTYRTAVDGGVAAGNQVGALVVAGELAHEAGHIADQVAQHQTVIASDLGAQMRQEVERIRWQDEYDTQREIVESAGDGRTRYAAQQRMKTAAGKLDSMGPTLLGPLDDDVDMLQAAGNGFLEDLSGGADLFARHVNTGEPFHPLQQRYRLEAHVPRLDAEYTRLVADNRALSTAIDSAVGERIAYIPAGGTRQVVMPRAVAEETLARNQAAAVEWNSVLRRNSDSLAVIDGRAAEEVTRLRGLDEATTSPEVLAAAQTRIDQLEPMLRNYARLVGEDNWAADAGQKALTGMISGAEPVNPQVLREMVGHEIGEYAATVIRTFNDLVAGRAVLDGNEMTALANEMAVVFGDNDLVGVIARASDLDGARAELSRSLTGAQQSMAQSARTQADHIGATLNIVVDTTPGGGGLRIIGQPFDDGPQELRSLIVDRLATSDWDPKLGVGARLRELQIRGERVATMRRGLPITVPGRVSPRDVAAFAAGATPEGEVAAAGWQHLLGRGAPAPEQLALRHDATLGLLDADVAASIHSEAANAAAETARQRQRVVDAINANNLARREAEHTYNQRLSDIGLELGQTRDKIIAAADDPAGIHEVAEALRSRRVVPTNSRSMGRIIDDLDDVNVWLADSGAVDAAEIAHTEAVLVGAAEAQANLEKAELSEAFYQAKLDQTMAQAAPAAEAITEMVKDGWRPIAEDLLRGGDGALMAGELARHMENLHVALRDPQTWKIIDKYTAFFKTYATARPGFHVRNAMSATFMNLVDGVRLGEISRAPFFWSRFMKNPAKVYEEADDLTRQAIDVVFASGAGGRFEEAAVAKDLGSRAYQALVNNRFTRWNQKMGGLVEGSARFAMAHDALVDGRSAAAALGRVRTFHFDYTEMSNLDRTMRRFIPFWTFMSRNLPLQIEAMWLRPRTYQQYMHLVNNFAQAPDPLTPEYWLAGGAFTVDPNVTERDSPWLIKPDLPFLGLTEQLEDGGSKLFADINPLFLAPFEAYSAGKKLYSQKPISDIPEAQGGVLGAIAPLLDLIPGTTTTRGQSGNWLVDPRVAHVATATLPPLEFLQRLLDTSGTRAGRQDETLLRTLGAPVVQLTPELRRSTRRSRHYDRLDAARRQAAIQRG